MQYSPNPMVFHLESLWPHLLHALAIAQLKYFSQLTSKKETLASKKVSHLPAFMPLSFLLTKYSFPVIINLCRLSLKVIFLKYFYFLRSQYNYMISSILFRSSSPKYTLILCFKTVAPFLFNCCKVFTNSLRWHRSLLYGCLLMCFFLQKIYIFTHGQTHGYILRIHIFSVINTNKTFC